MSECPLPMSVAAEEILLWEMEAIERHYGKGFDALTATNALLGLIWVYANRGDNKVSWDVIGLLSAKAAQDFFAPEPKPLTEEEEEAEFPETDGSANGQLHRGDALHSEGIPSIIS